MLLSHVEQIWCTVDASWRKSIVFLLCLIISALFCVSDACAGRFWKCEHMVQRKCRLIRSAPSVSVQPECFIIVILVLIMALSCEICSVSSLHPCRYCSFHLVSAKNRQRFRTQCIDLLLTKLPWLLWTLLYWYNGDIDGCATVLCVFQKHRSHSCTLFQPRKAAVFVVASMSPHLSW